MSELVGEISTTQNLTGEIIPGGGGGGQNGFSPTVEVETNTPTEYILTITDINGSYATPNLKGQNGIDGQNGINGIDGTNGEDGEQGIQGLQGLKGDKGDTGEQGIQGIDGADGQDLINQGETVTVISETASKQLQPNVICLFDGVVSSLTITLPTTINFYDEYNFIFTTSSTGCNLSIPASVVWDGGTAPTLEVSKKYEVSILNNVALISGGISV